MNLNSLSSFLSPTDSYVQYISGELIILNDNFHYNLNILEYSRMSFESLN